jgi:hypothetical protein
LYARSALLKPAHRNSKTGVLELDAFTCIESLQRLTQKADHTRFGRAGHHSANAELRRWQLAGRH